MDLLTCMCCYSIICEDFTVKWNFINIVFFLSFQPGSGQMCRPHFHTPLHSWITDTKPIVPHAHSGWITPYSTKPTLNHHSPSTPLSVYPGTNSSHNGGNLFSFPPTAGTNSTHNGGNLFTFPPTPPKDNGTPDMAGNSASVNGSSSAPGTGNSVNGGGAPSGTPSNEYSPDSKPMKSDSGNGEMTSSFSPSFCASGYNSAPSHPMPTYPAWATGSDYTSSALFHPANMFKAATLARVRTKSRTSSGMKIYLIYIYICFRTNVIKIYTLLHMCFFSVE